VYVANYGSDTVSVIDDSTNAVTDTISVGTNPIGVAYDSATGAVYVANEESNTVSVIDGSTNAVTETITVGTYPFGVAYDSATGEVYVADELPNTVSVISSTSTTTISWSWSSSLNTSCDVLGATSSSGPYSSLGTTSCSAGSFSSQTTDSYFEIQSVYNAWTSPPTSPVSV